MALRVALSSSSSSSSSSLLAARFGSIVARQMLVSIPSSFTVCAVPCSGGGRGRSGGGGRGGGAAFRVSHRGQLSDSDCWRSGQTSGSSNSKTRPVVEAGGVLRPAGGGGGGAARLFPTSSIHLSGAGLVRASAMGQEVVAEEEKMDPVQKRLMFDDECILVDDKDNVVGHESKYNCHLMEKIEGENLLHRAFSVFLFNSKNELLLQKRSATKVTFPLVWTNTCCSHPLYRESELIKEGHLGVRNAAQRKLFDELGIEAPDAPVDDFTCLGRILYKAPSDGKWGEHELDYLVFMKKDVALKPNPEEVADVMYVTKEQLKELVAKAKKGEDGVKLSPWFQLVVENFLYDWWKRVEEGTLLEVADMKTIHKL